MIKKDLEKYYENLKYKKYIDLIGNTPMIDISSTFKDIDSRIKILAKCEFMNPTFSIKDRMVKNIILDAIKNNLLRKKQTIITASSGNTGASVAMYSALLNHPCVVIVPEKCSKEKIDCVKAYGAEIIVEKNYRRRASEIAIQRNWFDIDQYKNPKNPIAYQETLGPEIWNEANGKITHFISAVSTGGTLVGTSEYLKNMDNRIKIIAADPKGSCIANYVETGEIGKTNSYLLEGAGRQSKPRLIKSNIIDKVITVSDSQAFSICRMLSRKEGILVGGSSGMNVYAAYKLAKNLNGSFTIVTVLSDCGLKYLSKIYNDNWIKDNLSKEEANLVYDLKISLD